MKGLTYVDDLKKEVQRIAGLKCPYPWLTIKAKYEGTSKQLDAEESLDSVLGSFGGNSFAFLVILPVVSYDFVANYAYLLTVLLLKNLSLVSVKLGFRIVLILFSG